MAEHHIDPPEHIFNPHTAEQLFINPDTDPRFRKSDDENEPSGDSWTPPLLFFDEFHELSARYFHESEYSEIKLSSGAVPCTPPTLALLLAYDLTPLVLTNIANENVSDAKVESQKSPFIDEKIKGVLSHTLPLIDYETTNEQDKNILKYLACGYLEIPNALWFQSYVQDALRSEVIRYQSPPSTWGTFQIYKGRIFLYDLDRAAMLYLREFQEKERQLWVEIVTSGLAIGTTSRMF